MAQVELQGVNKAFGKTEVIRNVGLEIEKKANLWSLLVPQAAASRLCCG